MAKKKNDVVLANCHKCGGSGSAADLVGYYPCPACGGSGEVEAGFFYSIIVHLIAAILPFLFGILILMWIASLFADAFDKVFVHANGFIGYVGTSLTVNSIVVYILLTLLFALTLYFSYLFWTKREKEIDAKSF